jgi:predicted RNA-binding protein associated with RNAse of E/G family
MNQNDIDNMNFALLAGQINPKIFKANERAYRTIHNIVRDHFPGNRTETIQMIFADVKNKAIANLEK